MSCSSQQGYSGLSENKPPQFWWWIIIFSWRFRGTGMPDRQTHSYPSKHLILFAEVFFSIWKPPKVMSVNFRKHRTWFFWFSTTIQHTHEPINIKDCHQLRDTQFDHISEVSTKIDPEPEVRYHFFFNPKSRMHLTVPSILCWPWEPIFRGKLSSTLAGSIIGEFWGMVLSQLSHQRYPLFIGYEIAGY